MVIVVFLVNRTKFVDSTIDCSNSIDFDLFTLFDFATCFQRICDIGYVKCNNKVIRLF